MADRNPPVKIVGQGRPCSPGIVTQEPLLGDDPFAELDRTMRRRPEPELMDAAEQARAYAEADFSEPNRHFVERALEHLDAGAGRLIDLGCGPGDICVRLARALPGWQVTGLDAGANMLALARAVRDEAGLREQVRLVHARLPDHGVDERFDAVVSNSLLHHLPDPMTLWRTIRELAAPGAFVQVMDLHRPPDAATAQAVVDEYAAGEPEVLRHDFCNSLYAAWTAEEVAQQLALAGLGAWSVSRPTDRHWLVTGCA